MESETNSFRVDFPDFSCSILQKLNQQRQLGQLCDITVVIQGRHYRAHRAVLAASSPYFCDQVLLKNSMRVVLPDVMHHCVFEGLLQSCYTGSLQLPAGEVVGYLTAASFLQMWHVVDKCTELLGGQRSCSGSDRLSPGGHEDDSTSEGLEAEPHGELLPDPKDGGGDADRPAENGSPATSSEQGGGEDGEGAGVVGGVVGGPVGGPGFQYASRLAYIQPSIMSHRRWIQVKAERLEQDGCQGFSGAGDPDGGDDPEAGDLNQASPAFGADLEEKLGGRQEEPLDFYGASMEEFSADQAGGPLDVDALEDDADGDGGGGGGSGADDGGDPASGLHGEASHQGLGSVYKLYPCQCGKSFTHKSQRDRHMSMHLGLRPYGCAVCGKRFKMKHHLVGHVKIHTGIKPYECSVCGKRFMWRDSFNRHVSSCTRAQQARRAAGEHGAPADPGDPWNSQATRSADPGTPWNGLTTRSADPGTCGTT